MPLQTLPIRALAAAALLILSSPAGAQEKSLSIELNDAADIDGGCRLTFVALNGTGQLLEKASFDIFTFGAGGKVGQSLVFEFGRLIAGKTRVLQFDLAGQPCASISRLLVNDASECVVEGKASTLCIDGCRTSTTTKLAFGLDAMFDVLIVQLHSAGGPVLIALVAVSVAALAVTFFKIVEFRRMGAGRSATARRAVGLWTAGDRARALEEAEKERSPASCTVAAAMRSLIRHPADRQRAQEVAAQAALDQLTIMSRYLRMLESIVQVAPMMGLLGTVIGMISAFGELSKGGGAIDPAALATGIWAALLTTAAGLAVAIPFYFVWVWLDSRVDDERATLEAAIGAVIHSDGAAERSAASAPRSAMPLPRGA